MGHPIAHAITANSPRIIMYHRFSEQPDWRGVSHKEFEEQLKYLKANFNIVRLTELARMLRERKPPGRDTVVLTIDDGYLDFFQIAAPLLVKYEVPATIFIVSNIVDKGLWLWDEALYYLTSHAPEGAYSIQHNHRTLEFTLHTTDDRIQAWTGLVNTVLYESNSRRWKLIRECQNQLGTGLPSKPPAANRSMNWDELGSLNPLIDIGSHTRNHPILSTVQDPDELASEILGSKKDIEKHIGKPVTTFCYPNGLAPDYNEFSLREIKRSGYECAVLAHGGLVTPSNCNLYELPRISAQHTLVTFKSEASGLRHLKEKYSKYWS